MLHAFKVSERKIKLMKEEIKEEKEEKNYNGLAWDTNFDHLSLQVIVFQMNISQI